ncbi:hypothetical protein T02_10100 [Trichinella nativa]|uniref:Uncharacterized protein n=1 Tax=Trichinella nativa TaxID=6335 RepID=A0A0V1KHF6_9BILA|nr:hypothetical protein T02_10100 [Trichinella nativa]
MYVTAVEKQDILQRNASSNARKTRKVSETATPEQLERPQVICGWHLCR